MLLLCIAIQGVSQIGRKMSGLGFSLENKDNKALKEKYYHLSNKS